MATELTPAEKESLAIGERLEQQEREQSTRAYKDAQETEQNSLQFAGKFRTAEDLEKAYLELEKKLGQPKDKTESTPQTESSDDDASDEQRGQDGQESSQESGQDQGQDQGPAQDQGSDQGPGQDEQGDQEAVQLTQEDANAILESVGGQASFDAMITWGNQNLPEADQEAYNAVLASGNVSAIKLATEGLMARFRANADFQGSPLRGRPGSTEPGARPFRSRQEVAAAMSDRRYERDPAYRSDVMARIAVSPDNLL
jgi:hypothetical protein